MKEGLKAALNEELKPLEQEIQFITKEIFSSKNVEEMTDYFRHISIVETIKLLHNIYKVNEEMKQIIQSRITNNKSRMLLPLNTPNRIITQLHRLYSFSKILSKAWRRRPINGNFEYAFQVIKDEIKYNVSKVVRELVEKDRIILKLKDSGMNLNQNNSVYNFEISQRSNTEVARGRIDENIGPRASMTSHSGKLSTSIFKETISISLNAGLGLNELGSQMNKKHDFESGEKLAEEILHVETSNSSSRYSKTDGKRSSKKTVEAFNGRVVNWKDTTENETEFVYKFYTLSEEQKMKIITTSRKSVLNKMRELKEVNDVATFQSPEKLPEHPEEDLRYILLARLTRHFQSMCVQIMTKVERKDNVGQFIKRFEAEQPQV
ncbi:MAG: hypothetical protein AAFY76_20955, partial [Cyanobacteria bacterium J06649_11]